MLVNIRRQPGQPHSQHGCRLGTVLPKRPLEHSHKLEISALQEATNQTTNPNAEFPTVRSTTCWALKRATAAMEQHHQKVDKNGNKAGTKWEQEPQSGTRMGTKWEQSGNKNTTVGQEWEQSGNKNPKVGMGQEWEQSGNKNPKVGMG